MRLRKILKIALETLLLAIGFLDVIWWGNRPLLGALALYFVCDFIVYRRDASLNFRASMPVRDAMSTEDVRKIETYYTSLEEFNSPEKRALTRPPLERFFYHLRYEQVRRLLDEYAKDAKRVLDLGCGFGKNTFYLCQTLRRPAIGLDLDFLKLREALRRARQRPESEGVAFLEGDAAHPPFKPSSFDCILMTEVLEHLILPEEGLAACSYLLREGGTLILTTPSRHNLEYSTNPLVILERILSLRSARLLPPYHNLHARYEYDRKEPEEMYGMHYHFSYEELHDLLGGKGFQALFKGSFEIEIPLFPIIEFICRGDLEKIRKYVRPFESIFQQAPITKYLGQHMVWVAQKR